MASLATEFVISEFVIYAYHIMHVYLLCDSVVYEFYTINIFSNTNVFHSISITCVTVSYITRMLSHAGGN